MLNSAPVQLLPIENGSGYKKASENNKTAEPKDRFENVFESVAKKEDSNFSDTAGKEVLHEKESGKQNKQKVEHNEDEDTTAASAQNDGKMKTAVEQQKSGLSVDAISKGDFADKVSKDTKTLKLVDTVKKKVSSVKKEAVRGGIKAAGETGFAGNGLVKSVFGKNAELKKTALSKAGKVTEKNSRDVNFIKTPLKGKVSDKPLIQLVSSAAESIKHTAGTAESKKSGIKLEKKAGKLKVVDHRQPQSVENEKAVKTGTVLESGSFKSAVEAAGSDVELNPTADTLKAESRTAETRTVQSSVLSQLQETVNSQIVKQAGIIVKGNGTGEIKLVMKPESLGKVRIHLSLSDNHIAGRIIVENNIVREIFESNLENLYKAFGAEGFENGGLEVSVQGKGGEADGNGRRSQKGFNGRAVKVIEDSVPELVDAEWQNNAVNMVV